MNLTLQSQNKSILGPCPRLATVISVVFISRVPFELKVKPIMNSPSSRQQPIDIFPAPAASEESVNPAAPAATAPAKTPAYEPAPAPIPDADEMEPGPAEEWRPQPESGRKELKLVEFSVEHPAAGTVRLAGDFTNWTEAPIDMIRFDDGIWSITLPLPAGIYAYRFLVDGEWYDDPRAVRQHPAGGATPRAYIQIK